MTAQEYLEQVYDQKNIISNLKRNKESVEQMLYSLGCSRDGDRVQSSGEHDKFGSLFGKIDDLELRIKEEEKRLIDLALTIASEIDGVKKKKHREVLHMRYIDFYKWEDIADNMPCSTRNVIRLHGLALEEFRNMYGKTLGLEEVQKEVSQNVTKCRRMSLTCHDIS